MDCFAVATLRPLRPFAFCHAYGQGRQLTPLKRMPLQVQGGVLAAESEQLLQEFFRARRQSSPNIGGSHA